MSSDSSKSGKRGIAGDWHSSTKQKQKTLGMAWGVISSSSSKSLAFSKRSPFSDFSSYMDEKNRKLRLQFDVDTLSTSPGDSPAKKGLFHGISIFVDGFTIPSSQELRNYMLKHGGRFENYFSRHRVTHIICSNLPDCKIKNLRSFSKGLPIVKPTWLLDSIAANRVLSWVPYQLDQLQNGASKQHDISSFFSLKNKSQSEKSASAFNSQQSEVEHCLASFRNEEKLSLDDASLLPAEEGTCLHLQGHQSTVSEHADCKDAELSSTETEGSDGPVVVSKSPTISLAPKVSSLGDSNFVENYFKSSRLHFIGTWRNRYRKRYCSSSLRARDSSKSREQTSSKDRTVIHIDMDCFFVAVVIRNLPELYEKPVAISHSDNPKGTAEISSANYPARNFGVRAGMFVRDAKALCPHLIIMPYHFEAYEEAVSCDEAFLDVTDLVGQDSEQMASIIRKEIFETTGCTASAGISLNMLMARLATRRAKPNGQYYISGEKVDDYLADLPIKELPGIGHALAEKLNDQNIQSCGQLRILSKETLRREFGTKTGEMLWHSSRGIDDREVQMTQVCEVISSSDGTTLQEIKSVGAEVNWGVRFNDSNDSRHFLLNLCKEVALRLQGCGMRGRMITLKVSAKITYVFDGLATNMADTLVKKRKKGAQEPIKYMGCGDCDNLSHSLTIPTATDDMDVLSRICGHLFSSFCLDVREVRGVGLQISKLEAADISVTGDWSSGHEKNKLESWLISPVHVAKQPCELFSPATEKAIADLSGEDKSNAAGSRQLGGDAVGSSCQMEEADVMRNTPGFSLPPFCQLDLSVLENLPHEIVAEINQLYNGKLDFIIKKNKFMDIKENSLRPLEPVDEVSDDDRHHKILGQSSDKAACTRTEANSEVSFKGKEPFSSPIQAVQSKKSITSLSSSTSSDTNIISKDKKLVDVMPSSLSQVDFSVLQELPPELRHDILDFLAPQRIVKDSFGTDVMPGEQGYPVAPETTRPGHPIVEKDGDHLNLWKGKPPEWVEKFKDSNCLILNILSEQYCKPNSDGLLSSTLHGFILSMSNLDICCSQWIEALPSFCELLKQYIMLKIHSDIEEIYVCFCILRSSGVTVHHLPVTVHPLPVTVHHLPDTVHHCSRPTIVLQPHPTPLFTAALLTVHARRSCCSLTRRPRLSLRPAPPVHPPTACSSVWLRLHLRPTSVSLCDVSASAQRRLRFRRSYPATPEAPLAPAILPSAACGSVRLWRPLLPWFLPGVCLCSAFPAALDLPVGFLCLCQTPAILLPLSLGASASACLLYCSHGGWSVPAVCPLPSQSAWPCLLFCCWSLVPVLLLLSCRLIIMAASSLSTVNQTEIGAARTENVPMQVINLRFTKENYFSWSPAMTMGIAARDRMTYIDGSNPEPVRTSGVWRTWFLEDNQVKTWIVNSVSPDIQPLILRKKTARDMWVVLEQMYGQKKTDIRTYQVMKTVYNLRQGSSSVAEYYGALKAKWEDYHSDLPWHCVRSQILNSGEVSSIEDVYSCVEAEEQRRLVTNAGKRDLVPSHERSVLVSRGSENLTRSLRRCTHCKKTGHTVDYCWDLHPDKKGTRGRPSSGKMSMTEVPKPSGEKLSISVDQLRELRADLISIISSHQRKLRLIKLLRLLAIKVTLLWGNELSIVVLLIT
ncbi:DNA repair protein [Nymphaea thermarum]|nr:DNA repair protein [Nymphaea thermarum]